MDESRALKLIRKYKTVKRISVIGTIAIALVLGVFIESFIVRVIVCALIPIFIWLGNFLITAKINGLLFDECDPKLYFTVSKGIFRRNDLGRDMLVSRFIGDYQKSISIGLNALQSKLTTSVRVFYYTDVLASAFIGGDFNLCKSKSEELLSFIKGAKIKKSEAENLTARCNFFLTFIGCDYEKALEYLDTCMSHPNQKNSYKSIMQYYKGITLYYSGKMAEASECFKCVCSISPEFDIAKKSEEYIKAIEADELKLIEIRSYNTVVPPTVSVSQEIKKIKMPIHKKIILVILCIIAFISVVQLISHTNREYTKEELPFVIEESEGFQVESIDKAVKIDDDHEICIFTTSDDTIGVTYLKKSEEDKYKYSLSYICDKGSIMYSDTDYYITVSGKSKKVNFSITDNPQDVSPNERAVEFSSNGEKYYFCYTTDDEKYHFSNSTGIKLN
ncbi:MAG: hypothetical protein ACI4XC_06005 [Eubacterium sp.]